jgi:proteasome lid subunit RPN8/RPN11
LQISVSLLHLIHAHGEQAYPDEGAGFLLGADGENRTVQALLPLRNSREEGARRNRYLVSTQDYLGAESEAERKGMALIGVFHSHPDHPDQPSEYDLEWAQPQFSYVITRVEGGRATGSRSWRLQEDRVRFAEESIEVS